jgi:hypothetical protein
MKWLTCPKIYKIFNKGFKGIIETDWTLCPKTTNAEEAQNKQANDSRSKLLIVLLEDWYRKDKKNCFKQYPLLMLLRPASFKKESQSTTKKEEEYTLKGNLRNLI